MPCGWPSKPGAPPTWRAGCRSAKSPCRPPPPRVCWIKDATAARRAALAILRAVARGAPFDQARDRAVADLETRDRRLAHELAAGVLRRRAELDRALDLSRADPRLHDVLRLGAYQLRWLEDRKSTRLNSSHPSISYAVFCLKKKNTTYYGRTTQSTNYYRL